MTYWWAMLRRPTVHLTNKCGHERVTTLCGLHLSKMHQLRNPAFIKNRNICKRCKLIQRLAEATNESTT